MSDDIEEYSKLIAKAMASPPRSSSYSLSGSSIPHSVSYCKIRKVKKLCKAKTSYDKKELKIDNGHYYINKNMEIICKPQSIFSDIVIHERNFAKLTELKINNFKCKVCGEVKPGIESCKVHDSCMTCCIFVKN